MDLRSNPGCFVPTLDFTQTPTQTLARTRDEVKFDVRLMQRVPYEGVSRMQTSLRRKHRDRVVRRGLALIIESDFYATDAGRQHFADRKCHASNPTTSPFDSRGDCCVRRAHVDPVLRPGGERPHRDVCALAPPSTALHCPRSPARPLPHAQTCNFDVLYACVSAT